MARPEASLWDYLRGVLPPEIHYSRIESETCPGFPDLHYTLDGWSATIEFKSIPKSKAKYPFAGKRGLRKSQKDWIEAELDANGWVWLLLEVKPAIFLVQAEMYYDELQRMTLSDIQRVSALHWKRGDDVEDQLAVKLCDW